MISLSGIERAGGRRRRDTGEDVAGFYIVFFEPLVGHLVHRAVEQADAAVAATAGAAAVVEIDVVFLGEIEQRHFRVALDLHTRLRKRDGVGLGDGDLGRWSGNGRHRGHRAGRHDATEPE